jgi:creatinine amidohydrolase
MRLEEMNWMDVERYLEVDDRIILITGATEQHAYLSLLTDILIPSRIAQAAAEREKVLVAPPFNFGYSRRFAYFPGTISITRNTFELVLVEIVESLLHQGFRKFFIVNGHGGNNLPPVLYDFLEEEEVRVVWYDWWREGAVRSFEERHQLRLNHANWGENFSFNRVAESPSTDKPTVELTIEQEDPQRAREALSDGSFGGPYQVDDALTQELFTDVVNEVAGLLRQLKS